MSTTPLRIGDKETYTFAEAQQILSAQFPSLSYFKRVTYEGKLPHHGGNGLGKIYFTNSDLKEIIAMSARPVRAARPKVAAVPVEPAVELPGFLKQTSRSRALHRGKAAA